MSKTKTKCVYINNYNTNYKGETKLLKLGYANYLFKTKKIIICSYLSDVNKLADIKILKKIKQDIQKLKAITNILITEEAMLTNILYKTITLSQIIKILEKKYDIKNINTFKISFDKIKEIKKIGVYHCIIKYSTLFQKNIEINVNKTTN